MYVLLITEDENVFSPYLDNSITKKLLEDFKKRYQIKILFLLSLSWHEIGILNDYEV